MGTCVCCSLQMAVFHNKIFEFFSKTTFQNISCRKNCLLQFKAHKVSLTCFTELEARKKNLSHNNWNITPAILNVDTNALCQNVYKPYKNVVKKTFKKVYH